MTPEEEEEKLVQCIANDAVTAQRLDTIEAHLSTQDVTLESLKQQSWSSQGAIGILKGGWPIIAFAISGIITAWFLNLIPHL
jgi:3-dehydroquinate dehydratase